MIRVEVSWPSYSGKAEGGVDDIVAKRFFRNQLGNCLEIGAARPDWLSLGAKFRTLGWDVLSVEPNPYFANLHRKEGHDVAQVAVGDHDSCSVPFVIVDSQGTQYRDGRVSFESWSSLGIRTKFKSIFPDFPQKIIHVRLCRADTVIKECRPDWTKIDLLTIDVEGWEIEALSGLSFDIYSPAVCIVENLFVQDSYRHFMERRGYILWLLKYPNEIYVSAELLKPKEKALAKLNCDLRTAVIRWLLNIKKKYKEFRRMVMRRDTLFR